MTASFWRQESPYRFTFVSYGISFGWFSDRSAVNTLLLTAVALALIATGLLKHDHLPRAVT